MEKNIKIVVSPFAPSMEVVGEMIIMLHAPYSEKDVTVRINPFLKDYQESREQGGLKIKHYTHSAKSEDTQTVGFDFGENKIQKIMVGEVEYELQLMQIGKENVEGQDLPYFEFYVKW